MCRGGGSEQFGRAGGEHGAPRCWLRVGRKASCWPAHRPTGAAGGEQICRRQLRHHGPVHQRTGARESRAVHRLPVADYTLVPMPEEAALVIGKTRPAARYLQRLQRATQRAREEGVALLQQVLPGIAALRDVERATRRRIATCCPRTFTTAAACRLGERAGPGNGRGRCGRAICRGGAR